MDPEYRDRLKRIIEVKNRRIGGLRVEIGITLDLVDELQTDVDEMVRWCPRRRQHIIQAKEAAIVNLMDDLGPKRDLLYELQRDVEEIRRKIRWCHNDELDIKKTTGKTS